MREEGSSTGAHMPGRHILRGEAHGWQPAAARRPTSPRSKRQPAPKRGGTPTVPPEGTASQVGQGTLGRGRGLCARPRAAGAAAGGKGALTRVHLPHDAQQLNGKVHGQGLGGSLRGGRQGGSSRRGSERRPSTTRVRGQAGAAFVLRVVPCCGPPAAGASLPCPIRPLPPRRTGLPACSPHTHSRPILALHGPPACAPPAAARRTCCRARYAFTRSWRLPWGPSGATSTLALAPSSRAEGSTKWRRAAGGTRAASALQTYLQRVGRKAGACECGGGWGRNELEAGRAGQGVEVGGWGAPEKGRQAWAQRPHAPGEASGHATRRAAASCQSTAPCTKHARHPPPHRRPRPAHHSQGQGGPSSFSATSPQSPSTPWNTRA